MCFVFFFFSGLNSFSMCSMEKREKHVGGCEQEKERNEVAFVSLDISCFEKKNVIFCIKCLGFNVKDFLSYKCFLSGRSGEITGN